MGQGIGEQGLAKTRIPVAQGGRGMSWCLPARQLRHTSSMQAMRWEAAWLSSAGEVFASHGIYKPLTPAWSELSLHPMKIQGGCSLLDLIPTLLTLPILGLDGFGCLASRDVLFAWSCCTRASRPSRALADSCAIFLCERSAG